MKKRFLTTLLGASLLLVACGGEKAADKPAAEAETVKIGAIGPLTGPVAIYGISATNGLKLAVDEINANGGILGKQVELNLLDEKGDSTEAVNAYNKLVDWGMVALVGDITSKPSVAVAEVAAQDGIPMITPTGTQLNITEAGSNIFRVCFTDPYQGEVLANFAKDKLGAKTVAVMSNNSSDYSDGIANAFVKEAENQGIEVVAREGYSDGDKDFRAQLTKIAQKNPDVLFVPDYYEQDSLIAIQAREVGLKSIITGSDGWDGVVKTVDPSSYPAIENVYFANHYSAKDSNEKVQNFIKNYKEKYNDDPSAFSALSYDTAYLLKAAIEKAGTTDKEAVTKAIKEIEFDGITGHLTFDEKNNPVKSITIIKIVNGDYTFDSVVSK
ncbi:ABC transporter substrate-binding protein [Fusobacterium simiae]|uniref:ABC transporter substrate-binding protein n=1 Tax=Fusobacterium simiae TaxID=855 RepID=A0ABT4DJ26_FUSSI|nr:MULTISPECIES: ABC transporter substrate-binding protein [Fusobacterium]MCY7008608.1 ABC transporter substrate-binding protein [Fusobacterium simiae]MDC7955858.1 ABC transporter substrate-binding protein [Fusobacterium simiae]